MRHQLLKSLEAFRKKNGLNQDELAARLGVGQSHLSRVISGDAAAGNKLLFRIRTLLREDQNVSPGYKDQWLEDVAAAARRSRSFKVLVDSALELARKGRT